MNFIYVHLNRLIKKLDLDMIYVTGPGTAGRALVANAYLEGTYSEVYPNISQDEEGMKRLFTQFSFPGGIPSHVAPETPGSIHEGGELGYSLSHAYGAAFDNPDLIVACVIGDGEAETGPLATSWHSNKFLNPARDGAVLPILHLNGYKIANPTVLARISHEELDKPVARLRLRAVFRRGPRPDGDARADGGDPRHGDRRHPAHPGRRAAQWVPERPRWPMIVMRTPKGWTCPKEIDGKRTEGSWRSHQVPMGEMRGNPGHVRILEDWMKSYRPEELFDESGRLRPNSPLLRRRATRRMSANPHANGGAAAARSEAAGFPRLCRRRSLAGGGDGRSDAGHGRVSARCHETEHAGAEFPALRPRREQFEPLAGRARGDQPRLGGRDLSLDDHLAPTGGSWRF